MFFFIFRMKNEIINKKIFHERANARKRPKSLSIMNIIQIECGKKGACLLFIMCAIQIMTKLIITRLRVKWYWWKDVSRVKRIENIIFYFIDESLSLSLAVFLITQLVFFAHLCSGSIWIIKMVRIECGNGTQSYIMWIW